MLNNLSLNESQDLSLQASQKKKKKRSLEDFEFINETRSGGTGKEVIGKGAFGSVKLAKEISTGQLFAIKAISKKILQEHSSIQYLKREIKLQKKLNHPHIIQLYGEFEDNENVYLLLEYAQNGCLFKHLRRKKKFQEKEAFVYFLQTALGVDYLHKMAIIHRDLKPENLLLDQQGNIKICDFGWSAESVAGFRNTFCGTLDYMSPEMLSNKPHDHRVDVWSLGVLLFEMLHGYAPFSVRNTKEKIIQAILSCDQTGVQIQSTVSTEAKDLIENLLKGDSAKRLSFVQIFEHPWLKKFEVEQNIRIADFITPSTLKKQASKAEQKSSQNRSQGVSPNIHTVKEDIKKQKMELFADPPALIPKNDDSMNYSQSNILSNFVSQGASLMDQSKTSEISKSRGREKIFDDHKTRDHPLNKYSISPNKYSVSPKPSVNQPDLMAKSAIIQQKYQDKGDMSMSKSQILEQNTSQDQRFLQQNESEQKQKEDYQRQQKEAEEQRQKEEQRLIEVQKQRDLEIQRQREIEAQKQRDLEIQRQREIEAEKLRDLEIQRQREIEAQIEIQKQQKQRELENQRILELQKQQEQQRVFEQKQLEIQRQQDLQKQKEQETLQREIEVRQREAETRQREIEAQRLEFQKQQEALRQQVERQRDIELQKQREQEAKRIRELEIQKQKEIEAQRLLYEAELLKQQREAEIHKQRSAELLKQREIETAWQAEQVRLQKEREIDILRQQDMEFRQRQVELQRREAEILKQQQELEEQRKKEADIRRQQEIEIKRQEDERQKQRQLEFRRQKELEEQLIRQDELMKAEQKRIAEENTVRLRQEQMRKQQEMERLELQQKEEMIRRQMMQPQIPEEDRVQYNVNSSKLVNKSYDHNITLSKEKELENRLDQILGQNFGILEGADAQPMRGDASLEESIQYKHIPEWNLSIVQTPDIEQEKQQRLQSQSQLKTKQHSQSPISRPTQRVTNNRITHMEDRNTYIGEIIDDCLDQLDLQDNPQIQALNQLSVAYGEEPKQRQIKKQPTPLHQTTPEFIRNNKFSFGEQKLRQQPDIDFNRQTKVQSESISYEDLDQQTKQQKKIQSNQKINTSQNNRSFRENEKSFQKNNRSRSELKQVRYQDEEEEENSIDRELKQFSKYDQVNQSVSSNKSNRVKKNEESNGTFTTKSQTKSRFQNYSQSKVQDQSTSYQQRQQIHQQQRIEEEKDEDQYSKYGPRRSRISDRNREIAKKHQIEIKEYEALEDMGFFDRVKFAFGCLTRKPKPVQQ